jgi:rhodanese-related sulfurtransferase
MFTINTPALMDLLGRDPNSEVLLINVMPPSEFERAHIMGSKSVPIAEDDFVDEVATLAGDKRRSVVVYCANQDCDASTVAAKQLENAGFVHVYDYIGGTHEWSEAGLPIESGQER